MRELQIPEDVKSRLGNSTEILRVVYDKEKNGMLCLARFEFWPQVAAESLGKTNDQEQIKQREVVGWGMAITDLIGHIANYMQSKGVPVDETIGNLLHIIEADFKMGQNIEGTTRPIPKE
jgi:hypothetical protein